MVFAVYTQNGGTAPIATAYSSISPYFSGSYFTGKNPSIYYEYWPHRLVIDLDDGSVIVKDEGTTMLSDSQIVSAVNAAND